MTSSGIHVLVLTSLFPSRPGEKNGNFVLDQVRELAAHGADVTVLVARPWIPNLLKSYCTPDRLPINERLFAPEKFELLNASFFSQRLRCMAAPIGVARKAVRRVSCSFRDAAASQVE